MSAGDRAGAKGCPTGKIRHKTPEGAAIHMAQLIAKDGSIRMNVYPCRACGGWHVGHKRGLKADITKALRAGSSATRSHRSRRNRR